MAKMDNTWLDPYLTYMPLARLDAALAVRAEVRRLQGASLFDLA
jgi:hypothetical protein